MSTPFTKRQTHIFFLSLLLLIFFFLFSVLVGFSLPFFSSARIPLSFHADANSIPFSPTCLFSSPCWLPSALLHWFPSPLMFLGKLGYTASSESCCRVSASFFIHTFSNRTNQRPYIVWSAEAVKKKRRQKHQINPTVFYLRNVTYTKHSQCWICLSEIL